MKIRKSSNIYRYIAWLDSMWQTNILGNTKSLCPLFWKTVLGTLLLPFMLIVFYVIVGPILFVMDKIEAYTYGRPLIKKVFKAIAFGLLMLAILTLIAILCILTYKDPGSLLFLVGIVVCVIMIAAIIAGIKILIDSYLEKRKQKQAKSNTTTAPQRDNSFGVFFVEGIKSIKNGICPLIEIVDDLNDTTRDKSTI